MKILSLFFVFFLSACSLQIVEMTPVPTPQKFDLSDGEGDGVILARDECPNSSVGAKVGNNGCGTRTIETLRRKVEVNFDTNSFVVKDEYIKEVKKLAEFLIDYPDTKVTIEGHTSIRGNASLNKILSKNRAEAIKEILIKRFNIAGKRIIAVGYGFEKL